MKFNDAMGYDLIKLPEGGLVRVFTKEEYRLDKNGDMAVINKRPRSSGGRGGGGRGGGGSSDRKGGRGGERRSCRGGAKEEKIENVIPNFFKKM